MEHFLNPQNAYKMKNANGEGQIGDPSCGDSLIMYIRVENNVIEEVSYLIFGCSAAIATSSMTSTLAKGKTIQEALRITEQDIVEALDGLPEEKLHCSNLGVSALKLAVADYEENKTRPKFQKIQIPLLRKLENFKNKIVYYMVFRLFNR